MSLECPQCGSSHVHQSEEIGADRPRSHHRFTLNCDVCKAEYYYAADTSYSITEARIMAQDFFEAYQNKNERAEKCIR